MHSNSNPVKSRLVFLAITILGLLVSDFLMASEDSTNLEKKQRLEILSFFQSNPEDSEITGSHFSIQLYNDAVEQYQKREFNLARQLLQDSIKHDRENHLAYELLGEIDYLEQKMAEAKKNYELAFSIKPTARLKEKLEKVNKEVVVEKKLATYQDERFIIKYNNRDFNIQGFELREMLRAAYRQVSQDLGHYFNYQIVVLLYDEQEFSQLTNRPHWATGLYDGKVRMPLKQGSYSSKELASLATHEVTHAFVAELSSQRAPSWINEGLAVYEENKIKPRDLTVYKAAIKTKSLYSLDDLTNQSSVLSLNDPLRIGLFYEQSFQLVDYLVKRYGMFKVKEMIREYGKRRDSDAVIREKLGISIPKLEEEWKSSITLPARS